MRTICKPRTVSTRIYEPRPWHRLVVLLPEAAVDAFEQGRRRAVAEAMSHVEHRRVRG